MKFYEICHQVDTHLLDLHKLFKSSKCIINRRMEKYVSVRKKNMYTRSDF